jgi:murein DD-endopeptidase MepM/ murein hydrolase activator NlpD
MKKISSFFGRQGFFIMLAVCVLIIVGSGIWAFREKNNEQSLAADHVPEFVQTFDQAERLRLYFPASGEVINGFSSVAYQSTLDRWGAHEAVDFLAEKGEDVFAAQAGTVIDAFRDAQWGGVIVVAHENGVVTRYCGLAWPLSKAIGNRVEARERIGVVSAIPVESGDPSHLHFEMWINGSAVDPEKYM